MFKKAANLIFHMTEHRPAQGAPMGGGGGLGAGGGMGMDDDDELGPGGSVSGVGPVKCTDCDKEFATKYQAKKHYLRRHFNGDKPFACTKCNKKRFVVKEDLTMHMKACGNVYICKCGIRLCSLGALKRHCKQFSHEPESLEPKPEAAFTLVPDPSAAAAWAAGADGMPAPYMASGDQLAQMQQRQAAAAAAAAAAMAMSAGADPRERPALRDERRGHGRHPSSGTGAGAGAGACRAAWRRRRRTNERRAAAGGGAAAA